ncbi:MAG: SUMF1/EgtB/PvdO family nonheme iron enzyme [Gammaproteobacteria bacterium]|nr:SUMF1/EgtB/PvdO family nonheme iron enzyme [Gammaproteobacteria bacterium]
MACLDLTKVIGDGGDSAQADLAAFADARYADWRPLGEGGTALVFRVRDRRLGLDVAIKVLKPEYAEHRRLLDGLSREILISRGLRHEGIAAIHDFYDGPAGVGVVMDLVDGITLKDWLRQHAGERSTHFADRFALFRRLLAILGVAHRDVVHRDLKPGNVMLRGGDVARPVIMDFGLSLPHAEAGRALREGTVRYAAPEQWRGEANVDLRADLFSMGVLAYELFTERLPFPRGAAQAMDRPPPPSSFNSAVPPAVDRLIAQLLAFDPADRPDNAMIAVDVLDDIEQDAARPATSANLGGGQRRAQAVVIPAGTVVIGSGPESDNSAEKPRRRVQISAFRLDRLPVTNADYRAYCDATGAPPAPFAKDERFNADRQPVVGVSHADASAYAAWVGGFLPSEAQWEYAARAAGKAVYPWGDGAPTTLLANLGRTNDRPLPVGSCIAGRNAWGLEDMSGNVWEWCADVWSADFYGALANGAVDPVCTAVSSGAARGEFSLRGGGFDAFPSMGRCAARFHAPGDAHGVSIGFRVAYPEVSSAEVRDDLANVRPEASDGAVG